MTWGKGSNGWNTVWQELTQHSDKNMMPKDECMDQKEGIKSRQDEVWGSENNWGLLSRVVGLKNVRTE